MDAARNTSCVITASQAHVARHRYVEAATRGEGVFPEEPTLGKDVRPAEARHRVEWRPEGWRPSARGHRALRTRLRSGAEGRRRCREARTPSQREPHDASDRPHRCHRASDRMARVPPNGTSLRGCYPLRSRHVRQSSRSRRAGRPARLPLTHEDRSGSGSWTLRFLA